MDSAKSPLFEVYLRLRPPHSIYPTLPMGPPAHPVSGSERFLTVEPPTPTAVVERDHEFGKARSHPKHITIFPPSESRKRAVEKFAFTRVFEEQTSQLDVFEGVDVPGLLEGVLEGCRDGLLATLGVTGSGKSHTILGSKAQRGITQLSLDVLFRSLGGKMLHPTQHPLLLGSLIAADASEAQISSTAGFLEGLYGESAGFSSRATTPMTVSKSNTLIRPKPPDNVERGPKQQWNVLGLRSPSPIVEPNHVSKTQSSSQNVEITQTAVRRMNQFGFLRPTRTSKNVCTKQQPTSQDVSFVPRRAPPHRPSNLPTLPDVSSVRVASTDDMDYTVLVSMYEVYNDRIFDLLSHPRNAKDNRRRPLLFKYTEGSPDRKVVAGLKKVVCGTYEEALMVLETGLSERRVAGTGSNSVSSRSHGFVCVEVKKRRQGGMATAWTGSQMTIVDLAGSERARNAKTAGATLAEAGKINESLMYLGQCLQLQGDLNDGSKSTVVPYRQCKLTELLFSNSFPSASAAQSTVPRNPQKAVMIVTADPFGDFNATSQILRYSALAKEITVPRIPSVTDIVFHGAPIPGKLNGRETPNDCSAELEAALTEIESLNDQVELLAMHLAEERLRREEAEENWQRAEDKCESIEVETREQCWNEVEQKMEEEKRRWMNAMGEEADRNDAHLDRKLEILAQVHEDPIPNRLQEVEDENVTLRRRIEELERQLLGRSPSKGTPLREIILSESPDSENKENEDHSLTQMASLSLCADDVFAPKQETKQLKVPKTPGKKLRKLTPRNNIGLGSEDLTALETP